jgi:DNA-binding beta-propeller fold protein YncE
MLSTVTLGSGEFTYEVDVGWEKPPPGISWREVAAVAVDSKDNVYAFTRGDHPIVVFDREGNFLRTWGEDIFTSAHGLTLGPDDTLYCTDQGDHTVRHCTTEGKVLMTIGVPGKPAEFQSGHPFHRCTDVALDPTSGDLYVSDGYGNSRVHKYSPDGKHLLSWGQPGNDPGEFNLVHNIATDKDGYVYVADRENHRVQVFDSKGKFETQWMGAMHRPCALFISHDQDVYIGELGFGMAVNQLYSNIGPRISVWNTDGERQARMGNGYGLEVGQFNAPHGIAIDSRGDLYLAEVAHTNMSHWGGPPDNVRSFQKLVKVAAA